MTPILFQARDSDSCPGFIAALARSIAEVPVPETHPLDDFDGGVIDATAAIVNYVNENQHVTFPHAVYGVAGLSLSTSNRTMIGGAVFKPLDGVDNAAMTITGDCNTIIGLQFDGAVGRPLVTGNRRGLVVNGDHNLVVGCRAFDGTGATNSAAYGYRNNGDFNVFDSCKAEGAWYQGGNNKGTSGRKMATWKNFYAKDFVARGIDHDGDTDLLKLENCYCVTNSTDSSALPFGLSSGDTATIFNAHLLNCWGEQTAGAGWLDVQAIIKYGQVNGTLICEGCTFIRNQLTGPVNNCVFLESGIDEAVFKNCRLEGRIAATTLNNRFEMTGCTLGDPTGNVTLDLINNLSCPETIIKNNKFKGFRRAVLNVKTPDANLRSFTMVHNDAAGDSTGFSDEVFLVRETSGAGGGVFVSPRKFRVGDNVITDSNPSTTGTRPCFDGDGRICMGDGDTPGYKSWGTDPSTSGSGAAIQFTLGDIYIHDDAASGEDIGWYCTSSGIGVAATFKSMGTLA